VRIRDVLGVAQAFHLQEERLHAYKTDRAELFAAVVEVE